MMRTMKTTTMLTVSLGCAAALGVPAALVAVTSPVTVTRVTSPEKALRFEVTVAGSVDDVWTAFTTKNGLATWLWRDIRVDLRPGGDWLALLPDSTAGGTIVSFVPKHQLVIAAMAPETFPTVRATRTTAVFEFRAMTPTSTHLTLVQSGWKAGREWDDAYEYLATGNAELLTQLYQRFVSGPLTWPTVR